MLLRKYTVTQAISGKSDLFTTGWHKVIIPFSQKEDMHFPYRCKFWTSLTIYTYSVHKLLNRLWKLHIKLQCQQ